MNKKIRANFNFYDIDIDNMKPSKLKDSISLNSHKNTNELIDNNMTTEISNVINDEHDFFD